MEEAKEEVLKDGSEARRLALSLRGVAYGEQLVDQLFQHSTRMEKMFEIVNHMLANGDTKDSNYSKFLKAYEEKSQWFTKAKVGLFKTKHVGLKPPKVSGYFFERLSIYIVAFLARLLQKLCWLD